MTHRRYKDNKGTGGGVDLSSFIKDLQDEQDIPDELDAYYCLMTSEKFERSDRPLYYFVLLTQRAVRAAMNTSGSCIVFRIVETGEIRAIIINSNGVDGPKFIKSSESAGLKFAEVSVAAFKFMFREPEKPTLETLRNR